MPRPVLTVSHGTDVAPCLDRARALRRDRSHELMDVDPAGWDVEAFAGTLGLFPSSTPVHVVHVVGDLDASGDEAAGRHVAAQVIDIAKQLHTDLRTRFPTIALRTWIVVRVGPVFGPAERHLLDAGRTLGRSVSFAGAIAVTMASGASISHDGHDVDRQVADIIHAIGCSDLERSLTSTSASSWAIGVGSVAMRPDRVLHAAIRSVRDRLHRLVEPRLRDPGYARGRAWIDQQGAAPAGLEPDGADGFSGVVLTMAPGSLAKLPSNAIRRLDLELEGVDPGRWAGYIATAIDAAAAPRTEPSGSPSPLTEALEQLQRNLAIYERDLLAAVESEAREHLAGQGSIPSAEAWCDGARAALDDAIVKLSQPPEEDPIDLAAAYGRLSRAARKLPYSSSTLVRALLLVVLMLVIGYALAPIGSIVGWALSKRLWFFGDSLEENARAWARLTAIGTGVIAWFWWEMKWRRVRRLRQRYIKLAVEQFERTIEHELAVGRVRVLRAVIARIGGPSGTTGTIRGWLRSSREAIEAAIARGAQGKEAGEALRDGQWAVTIPADDEPLRVLEDLSPERRVQLETAALDSIGGASLGLDADAIEADILARLRGALPDVADDLDRQWTAPDEIGDDALQALRADLWPGLPEDLASRRGAERRRHLVATPHVEQLVRAREIPFEQHIASLDTCFAANLWVTALVPSGGAGGDLGAPEPSMGPDHEDGAS